MWMNAQKVRVIATGLLHVRTQLEVLNVRAILVFLEVESIVKVCSEQETVYCDLI